MRRQSAQAAGLEEKVFVEAMSNRIQELESEAADLRNDLAEK